MFFKDKYIAKHILFAQFPTTNHPNNIPKWNSVVHLPNIDIQFYPNEINKYFSEPADIVSPLRIHSIKINNLWVWLSQQLFSIQNQIFERYVIVSAFLSKQFSYDVGYVNLKHPNPKKTQHSKRSIQLSDTSQLKSIQKFCVCFRLFGQKIEFESSIVNNWKSQPWSDDIHLYVCFSHCDCLQSMLSILFQFIYNSYRIAFNIFVLFPPRSVLVVVKSHTVQIKSIILSTI